MPPTPSEASAMFGGGSGDELARTLCENDGQKDPSIIAITQRLTELEREAEWNKYRVRYHLSADATSVTGEIELVIVAAFACLKRFITGILSLLFWILILYLIAKLSEYLIRYAFYDTMHYVIDPVIDMSIKILNDIFDGLWEAINAIKNTASKAGSWFSGAADTIAHGVGIHSHLKTSVHTYDSRPLHIDKAHALGRWYMALVHMKSLCSRYKSHWSVFHIAMEAFTHSSLCRDIRDLYPSPLLRWLSPLFYSGDFANPETRNCEVTPAIGVCLAWNFNLVMLLIRDIVLYSFWIWVAWPIVTVALVGLRTYFYTLLYMLHHRHMPWSHHKKVLNHYFDKDARFVTSHVAKCRQWFKEKHDAWEKNHHHHHHHHHHHKDDSPKTKPPPYVPRMHQDTRSTGIHAKRFSSNN